VQSAPHDSLRAHCRFKKYESHHYDGLCIVYKNILESFVAWFMRCSIIQNADMVPMVSVLHEIMKRPIKRWLCVSRILVAIHCNTKKINEKNLFPILN
jgi:hypothetical protein